MLIYVSCSLNEATHQRKHNKKMRKKTLYVYQDRHRTEFKDVIAVRVEKSSSSRMFLSTWTCHASYRASFESIGELFVSCDFCCSIDSDGREEPVILDDLSTMRRSFLHQRLSKLSYQTDMDEVIIR